MGKEKLKWEVTSKDGAIKAHTTNAPYSVIQDVVWNVYYVLTPHDIECQTNEFIEAVRICRKHYHESH